MINEATNEIEALRSCRCCLVRPPDKDLKTPYEYHETKEIYLDMIKACFDIQIYLGNEECGICERCVGHLRDAQVFKLRVLRSQAVLQEWAERALHVKDEVKSGIMADSGDEIKEDHILYEETAVKPEMSDDDAARGDEGTTHEGLLVKSEMSDRDACAEDSRPPGWGSGQSQAARACARAGERLATPGPARLERLRDDAAPTACHACHRTFGPEPSHATNTERVEQRTDTCDDENTFSAAKNNKYDTMHTRVELQSTVKHHTHVISRERYNIKCLPRQIGKQTGHRPFSCDECNQRFKAKNHLKEHLRTHSGEKPYECDVCGLRLTNRSSLKCHKRIHTGEKPYACNMCEKRFTKSNNLRRHIGTHTNEKPFGCDECDRRFLAKDGLSKHKRVHTGDKPYTCDICDRRFSQKSNLTSHIKRHSE